MMTNTDIIWSTFLGKNIQLLVKTMITFNLDVFISSGSVRSSFVIYKSFLIFVSFFSVNTNFLTFYCCMANILHRCCPSPIIGE